VRTAAAKTFVTHALALSLDPRATCCGLIVVLALLSAPAAAAGNSIDKLEPGHWYEVPNSKFNHVAYAGPLADKVHAVSGPKSVLEAWSGGALDTKRHRLVVWGGGHTDYAGNELYAFDLKVLAWVRLTDPSDPCPSNPCLDYREKSISSYPDGKPVSRHTYNGLAYLPDPYDRLFAQGGALYASGGPDRATWLFDFEGKSWSRMADVIGPPNVAGVTLYDNMAAYDPVTKTVWFQGGRAPFLNEYNPSTDSWTPHGGSAGALLNIYTTEAIDPQDRLLVAVGGRSINKWALSGKLIIPPVQPTSTGDKTIENAENPGFVYYPPGHVFVGWAGGAKLFALDPTTWNWSVHVPASGNTVIPPPVHWGVFGRFQYDSAMNVFIAVNAANENVYIYRPDFGTKDTVAPN
jgi:hypothetical protein